MELLDPTGWEIRQTKRKDQNGITSIAFSLDLLVFWGFIKLITTSFLETCTFYLFIILLTLTDLIFVVLNFITTSRTNETVIPPAFSPASPPPFSDHPFIHCLCKLTFWLGEDAPEWMQEWSRWDGIMLDGRWPPVNRKLDLDQISRCPCPALNALANHGILKECGEGLSFHGIAANISRTYNLSPTLAIQLLSAAWPLFQGKKLISLEALTAHGLIEHDASLLRPDLYESSIKAQTKPDQELIARFFPEPKMSDHQELKKKHQRQKRRNQTILSENHLILELETEGIKITHSDFSYYLKQRRDESKMKNPSCVQNFLFNFFGSGNCALLVEIFNGNLYDIRTFIGAGIPIRNNLHPYPYHRRHQHVGSDPTRSNLNKSQIDLINFEVLPHDRWRPSNLRHPWGLTIFKAMYSTLKIEARI